MLLIDLDREVVVYYNRALVLIYEDFKKNKIIEYASPVPNGEPVQLDYCTNKSQRKIWGVSDFNKDRITFSEYTFVWD
jgi:hypothetical protein